MERLTCKELSGNIVVFPKCKSCYGDCTYCDYQYNANKKLKEYEDAEESGMLIRLPFEVNSKIYVLVKMFDVMENKMFHRIEVYTVNKYIYNHLKNFVIVAVRKYGAAITEEHFYNGEIGKKIFKTYAEAESALQEKQEKGD